MRLAAKLVSVAILAIVVVSAVNGYLRVRREIAQFHTDMRRDVMQLARATTEVVVEAWKHSGQERAETYVQRVDRADHAIRVRLVWLTKSAEPGPHPTVALASLVPLESGESVFLEVRKPSGEGHLYTYAPLDVSSTIPCALEFSESLADLDNYTRATVVRVVIHTLAMVILSGIGVLMFGVFVVGHPLRKLVDKVHRVGLGDLSAPLTLHSHDELSRLAYAINEMCKDLGKAQADVRRETEARIAAIEQLRHADRLKTVGRLASGLAHEMGTPLNVISGRASLLSGGKLSPQEANDSAVTIKTQADRITALVRQLLDFARRRTPNIEPVDLCKVVRDALDLLKAQSLKYKATLSSDSSEATVMACVDAGQIQQVVVNLMVNAMQALRDGGKVSVNVAVVDTRPPAGSAAKEGRYVRITVSDDGTGISEEDVQHLFEPFFTTKDVGQGTGLGLPIAYGIVQEHGGWIDVQSQLGHGSSFSVFLPLGEQTCQQES
jgi:two-component system NtrC family sensor kinase